METNSNTTRVCPAFVFCLTNFSQYYTSKAWFSNCLENGQMQLPFIMEVESPVNYYLLNKSTVESLQFLARTHAIPEGCQTLV